MKKILFVMTIAAALMGGCGRQRPAPLQIDDRLTEEQIAQGTLTPDILWKMGRVGVGSLSMDGNRLLYTVTRYNLAENRGVTAICLHDATTGQTLELTDLASNNSSPQWSADNQRIYFLSDRSGSNQIWEMKVDGTAERQLSRLKEEIEGFGVNATEDKVFYVQRVHIADRLSRDVYSDMDKSKARIYDDLMCRHWDYWDEGSYRHIFVADFTSRGVRNGVDIMGADAAWDAPLAPYFDMSEIVWNNAGTQLAYTCKPLAGKEYAVSTDSDIFVYDLPSGTTVNICKTDPSQPDALPGYDKYPVFSPDDSRIAFLSQRRPGNESDKTRLMVWNAANGSMHDVTAAFDFPVSNVIWDGNDALWMIAAMRGTHQLCHADYQPLAQPDAETVKPVTRGDHDVNAVTISNGRAVADICTISRASELYDINLQTGRITPLTHINDHIFDHLRMGEVQKRWVQTTDGKQMLTWVILPPDFDPEKRYPAILFCEGGPQSVVSQFWSYRWNFQLMAAQGYIVVAPNRRGVPSFGQEWCDQISGDYSGQNISDYLSAIDDVAAEAWVDRNRMGCVGASYGGYSVYYLAGVHQGRFKAFISHCGIFDFDAMYGHTEELFFVNNDYGGSYWDRSNPTAMRTYAHSPHRLVQNWDTPIMVITGEWDFRIPYTQSLEAFTAARMRGIPSRLVVFENEAHQVFKPQNSIVWNREFFGWLDQYLK